ncbi:cysteine protease StiP domain-containing protein [Pararhodospirillum photometricum]|uniref:Uncharacterized protein n=1 Tax=Pararhodospirillum photometricum DSM 122 TaxID=1150469 RepID=H6SKG0_PARPM|nr:cysteine protease StiP domain-containing protein [Pararhodospirillum photometricum]CCG08475.1 Putative uncharacterized protein [Pararhodospirillum photometricum DSM 122]
MSRGFSGSYDPADVTFLLTPLQPRLVDVATKEALIQGGGHYSEMLSPEAPPTPAHREAFHAALALTRERVGRDVARLARALAERPGNEVVLVSLARAGTPLGILLRRALAALDRPVVHYSVSILRDRGLDAVALRHILAHHRAPDVVFVDGWTGKGTMAGELTRALARDLPSLVGAPLAVVSDLAGVADLAAGADDYVIPWAVLNGIVSGLVSRTVLDPSLGPDDFHGCLRLDALAADDLSRWVVDTLTQDVRAALPHTPSAVWPETERQRLALVAAAFLARWPERDRLLIKPGIGEATRALLRRVPERLLVQDPALPDTRHLIALAEAQGVAVEVEKAMPYRACVFVKPLGGGAP